MILNLLINYSSQLFTIFSAILSTPLLIKYLGLESFGLISFYLSILAGFSLLELGMIGGITRECIRFRERKVDEDYFNNVISSINLVFLVIAIIGATIIVLLSYWISSSWIKPVDLTRNNISNDIILIGLIIGVRFYSGFFRAILSGYEKHKFISTSNVLISLFRYFIVIPIVIFFDNNKDLIYFFYQLLLSLIEFIFIYLFIKRKIYTLRLNFSLKAVKTYYKFSSNLVILSSIWVILNQFDKIILSKRLTLIDFGIYSSAITLAGGILILNAPLSAVMLPIISRFYASDQYKEALKMYVIASKVLVIISLPCVLSMVLFPGHILFAWTGNLEISINASFYLSCYAVGNFFLILSGMPYLLQFAKGNLRPNIRAGIIFLLFYLVIAWEFIDLYAAKGAAISWAGINVLNFIFYVAWIHRLHLKGFEIYWLKKCIFGEFLVFAPILLIFHIYKIDIGSRQMSILVTLLSIIIPFLIIILLNIKEIRSFLSNQKIIQK